MTTTAHSLGVHAGGARLAPTPLFVALLTAGTTAVPVPLSLDGLPVPHLTRLPGFSGAGLHLLDAALPGTLPMLLTDWPGGDGSCFRRKSVTD